MVKLLSHASIDKVMTLSNPLVTNEKLTKTAVKVLHHSSLSCTASVCYLIKTYQSLVLYKKKKVINFMIFHLKN